jgi:hypothetical protein
MWSRKGICVCELHTPVPSRVMLTSTLVSFVSLFTVADRTAYIWPQAVVQKWGTANTLSSMDDNHHKAHNAQCR